MRCICQVSCTLQVLVYHAPKISELQLEGKEGTVKQIVKVFKGKELSANLPYKVEFLLEKKEGEKRQQKVWVHLVGHPFLCRPVLTMVPHLVNVVNVVSIAVKMNMLLQMLNAPLHPAGCIRI